MFVNQSVQRHSLTMHETDGKYLETNYKYYVLMLLRIVKEVKNKHICLNLQRLMSYNLDKGWQTGFKYLTQ